MKFLEKLLDVLGNFLGKYKSLRLGFGWPKKSTIRSAEYLIHLPDGAKLATRVYIPRDILHNCSKVPTILIRTPYWINIQSITGRFFASQGYVCVMQDIRGCAHSSPYGMNTLMISESDDGRETIKWIKKQFWYNGKLGGWGLSYPGLNQWAIAFNSGGLITCINPMHSSFHNIWNYHQGLIINEQNAAIALILLITSHSSEFNLDVHAIDKIMFCKRMVTDPTFVLFNEPMESLSKQGVPRLKNFKGKPLAEIPNLLSNRDGSTIDFARADYNQFYKLIFRIFVKHQINLVDRYMPSNINIGSTKELDIPVLMGTGWGDIYCENTIRDYIALFNNCSSQMRKNIKLFIGPWDHFGTIFPGVSNSNSNVGKEMNKLFYPLYFYNNFLKDLDSEWDSQAPVRIFVLGKNIWRNEQEWPLSRAVLQKWYLHSNGHANSKKGDGRLSIEEPDTQSVDEYDFDPMNPVITAGGRNLFIQKKPQSQHLSENRKDVLVYTSDPLSRGMEVTGRVVLDLYAESSAIDTDFMAKFCDVSPDGKSIILIDGGVRARFRDGQPKPIIPGEVYLFEIDIGHISIFFRRQHKIRLDITSSNFPRFDVNSNLGGQKNEKGYVKAHQKVFHTSDTKSVLILPVIENCSPR